MVAAGVRVVRVEAERVLGGDHPALAPRLGELADEALARPVRVVVRGVDEVAAGLVVPLEDPAALVRVGAPAPVGPEGHRAEGQLADAQPASAEELVAHGDRPLSLLVSSDNNRMNTTDQGQRIHDASAPGPAFTVELRADPAFELLIGLSTLTTERDAGAAELAARRPRRVLGRAQAGARPGRARSRGGVAPPARPRARVSGRDCRRVRRAGRRHRPGRAPPARRRALRAVVAHRRRGRDARTGSGRGSGRRSRPCSSTIATTQAARGNRSSSFCR